MQIHSPLHPWRAKRLRQYITGLNPVGYWPLWEKDGSVAKNYAPANLGSFNGVITGVTTGQAGLVGKACSFDGGNDLITIVNNTSLNPVVMTAMVLVKVAAFDATGNHMDNVIAKEGANAGYCLRVGDQNVNFMVGDNSGTPEAADTAQSMSIDTWYLVVGTYDGTNIKVYLNDILKDTQASGTYQTTSNDLLLGRYTTGAERYFDGLMQHVALFDKVLATTQITKLVQMAGLA
jgi:hypothetical protein